jgi:hypothetical protein
MWICTTNCCPTARHRENENERLTRSVSRLPKPIAIDLRHICKVQSSYHWLLYERTNSGYFNIDAGLQ